MEAHSATTVGVYDKVKQALMQETDRPFVLRQAIQAVRKGGTLSIPGVYGGVLDKVNFGAAFGKGIHMNMGQTHMRAYLQPLLKHIEKGDIDTTFLISHRIGIEQAPAMYATWQKKEDAVTKINSWADELNLSTNGESFEVTRTPGYRRSRPQTVRIDVITHFHVRRHLDSTQPEWIKQMRVNVFGVVGLTSHPVGSSA